MKAAVFREVNVPMEVEEIEVSKPGPREVLVRTAAAGVCHSDMHFFNGTYPGIVPMVLGHESAGIVEAVGSDVQYVEPGDHVITCLSVFCGHCEHCLTGHMSLCQEPETQRGADEEPRISQSGTVLQQFAQLGSFAEMMLVHEHAVAKIREDMPLDRAALIGCGVTTGVGAVIHTANVRPGETVAVIGCGGIGLSCVNGAAIAGAGRIIAVDMVPSKLELARKFGATDAVNAGDGDPIEQVKQLTGGGVHYSFEAIGLKVTAEQAFGMLQNGGTATVIGMIPPGDMVSLHGPEFLMEKKIQGSFMGSNRFRVDMPRFVDFYLQGKLHLDDLVSNRIKLADVNDALHALESGEVARSVIMFD
ncbi:MAG: Zn-dependent alcohol dehydrogenase [Pseudomonadales bacterium]|jgi:S-(hydroxymethyl)glutathione dehydrogenase/alcohol dehydrogenase|nr:Zn-dependent alcohol dehydrogenase [Pseudomonadales bacterium]MDP6470547.1 Zn-dependent alcohol dehydrogenase [Pseudomonadales bacterium]MDP6827849.1 Zn-dependent alcohol dehydrogenase [Pseudomonadales bacterium]MDP6970562.1 Zn-dependent alcohol dehydrogenase [Pseudomonadales bacterium]